MPNICKKCVATHKQPGFNHIFITNDNYYHCKYVDDCIKAKHYAKASDYLRIYYLYHNGWIYMDTDSEIIKPLDKFLKHDFFVCEEENRFIANGVIWAKKWHPLLDNYLKTIENNFIGSGDLVFTQGVYLFTELVKYSIWSPDITIYPAEWFLPYNHQSGVTNITENSHCLHHYTKLWLPVDSPK